MKISISLLAILILFAFSIQTFCQFNYNDFSSTDGLNLLVNAAQVGNKLRVSPASTYKKGAVWYIVKQSIENGFETTFKFQLTDQGGNPPPGADGIAFVIQNVSESIIGPNNGGYLAYSDITNSIAIEFDTWPNTSLFADPNGNHVSVQTRGLLANSPHHNYSLGSTTTIPNLKDGSVYTAKIVYNNSQLVIYLNDLFNPILTVDVNLTDTLALDNGRAWVGFTSATASAYENHDLISWSFEPVQTAFQLSVPISDGWNLVSIPGFHPINQNVTTWWPGLDPTTSVYKFSGAYQQVTTVIPAEGYWMKNLGAQTYNTGDEWPSSGILIVPHDPIIADSGWNIIGGYENIVDVTSLTTTPPGQIVYPIYEFLRERDIRQRPK